MNRKAFLLMTAIWTFSCQERPLQNTSASSRAKSSNQGADSEEQGSHPSTKQPKDLPESMSGEENVGEIGEEPETGEMSSIPKPEPEPETPKPVSFKFLTLNVWTGNPNEIARDIKKVAPDLVCVQEATSAEAKATAQNLGGNWKAVVPKTQSEFMIITKLPIIEELGETSIDRGGLGAVIAVADNVKIAVFCHHGNYVEYGPYLLGKDKKSVASVLASEESVRGKQMRKLLEMMEANRAKGIATLLAGDFNAPSHVDYNPAVAWPVSTMIHAAGYSDSYAELHPNNKKSSACKFSQNDPGITWARLLSEEPYNCFDRIDFIYFQGKVKPIESATVDLDVSDHRSLYTIFETQ